MIVFPMAGLSKRFSEAGYNVPKWMLPLAGRPLLDWSFLSFERYFQDERFLIIYLDLPGAGTFVRERCDILGIANSTFVALKEPTLGQADTVRLGLDAINIATDEPLTIFNVDTIRPRYEAPNLSLQVAGWLETFIGNGDHWSFVLPDEARPGLAAQVVEKHRISSFCCTGLYHFASVEVFQKALALEQASPSMNELYVAPLYQRLIETEANVGYTVVNTSDVYFSGTPDEYMQAKQDETQIATAFAR